LRLFIGREDAGMSRSPRESAVFAEDPRPPRPCRCAGLRL